MEDPREPIEKGTLVQLNPYTVLNTMFACCILVVTESKPWGVVGYVQALGENGEQGGLAFYRADWKEFEIVGMAHWTDEPEEEPDGSGTGQV